MVNLRVPIEDKIGQGPNSVFMSFVGSHNPLLQKATLDFIWYYKLFGNANKNIASSCMSKCILKVRWKEWIAIVKNRCNGTHKRCFIHDYYITKDKLLGKRRFRSRDTHERIQTQMHQAMLSMLNSFSQPGDNLALQPETSESLCLCIYLNSSVPWSDVYQVIIF